MRELTIVIILLAISMVLMTGLNSAHRTVEKLEQEIIVLKNQIAIKTDSHPWQSERGDYGR